MTDRRTIRKELWVILKALLPRNPPETFGAVIGGLSLFALMKRSYALPIGPVVALIMDRYDRIVNLLFGWAREPIEGIIFFLFDYHLALGPIWAHVSLLCGIYFTRNVVRLFFAGRRWAALYQLLFSLPLMTASGAGAGIFYLDGGGFGASFMVAAFPVAAVFVMAIIQGLWFATVPTDRIYRTWPDFGGSWPYFMAMQIWYGIRLLSAGLLLDAACTLALLSCGIPNPSILVLFVLLIFLALYWLLTGMGAAKRPERPRKNAPLTKKHVSALLATPGIKLGIAMLRTAFAFAGLVVVGAGASLIGL